MTTNQFTSILSAFLQTILTGLLTYVGIYVVRAIPKLIDFIVLKIGKANYEKLMTTGWDIWNIIEEHFRISQIIGDEVDSKTTMFETLIKQKLPGITDEEIATVRQAIAGEFNKDKPLVVQAIETPIVEPTVITVTPIVKYVNAEGVELQPVAHIV